MASSADEMLVTNRWLIYSGKKELQNNKYAYCTHETHRTTVNAREKKILCAIRRPAKYKLVKMGSLIPIRIHMKTDAMPITCLRGVRTHLSNYKIFQIMSNNLATVQHHRYGNNNNVPNIFSNQPFLVPAPMMLESSNTLFI